MTTTVSTMTMVMTIGIFDDIIVTSLFSLEHGDVALLNVIVANLGVVVALDIVDGDDVIGTVSRR